MKKLALEAQTSLEVEDYMDRFDSDQENQTVSNAIALPEPTEEECTTEHVKLRVNSGNCTEMSNRKAPTMIIEAVQIGRPLKTLSLIANFAVIIFFFLSTSGSNWVLTPNFRIGLLEECVRNLNTSNIVACNRNPCSKDYIKAFFTCSMLGLIISIISSVLLACGMKTAIVRRKTIIYNCIFSLHIAQGIFFLISLIGYPISFIQDTANIQRMHFHGDSWGFGWSYVMGWLGVVAVGISTGLLHFDKDGEEIIFYEKISRNSCPLDA